MTVNLAHGLTGHEIESDPESLEFWKAAGYRETDQKATPKKSAKKAAPSSKSSK